VIIADFMEKNRIKAMVRPRAGELPCLLQLAKFWRSFRKFPGIDYSGQLSVEYMSKVLSQRGVIYDVKLASRQHLVHKVVDVPSNCPPIGRMSECFEVERLLNCSGVLC
jgi:hypothetical protein